MLETCLPAGTLCARLTSDPTDDFPFEMDNSPLHHASISNHAGNIYCGNWRLQDWSTLVGKEATGMPLIGNAFRRYATINMGHIRRPDIPQSPRRC